MPLPVAVAFFEDQPTDALSRRLLLQGMGAVGAGLALSPTVGGVAAAAPKRRRQGPPARGDRPGRPYLYLAGDHHIHRRCARGVGLLDRLPELWSGAAVLEGSGDEPAVLPAVGDVHPTTVLDPAGHVRPRLRDGQLVLVVRPGPGGTVVPVEKQHEHACAGH
ncbi:MAG: hypothetical protein ACR2K2_09820 [Mycobacteriales bacterium]